MHDVGQGATEWWNFSHFLIESELEINKRLIPPKFYGENMRKYMYIYAIKTPSKSGGKNKEKMIWSYKIIAPSQIHKNLDSKACI
jgi:hypothetical protein